MTIRGTRFPLVLPLILLAVFLTGCPQSVTIGEINRDPGRWAGKEVAITGNVVDSFGALSEGVFEVDDGTGRMWVLSEGYGVPSQGVRVRVAGRVVSGVTVAGRAFGTALRETQRRQDLR